MVRSRLTSPRISSPCLLQVIVLSFPLFVATSCELASRCDVGQPPKRRSAGRGASLLMTVSLCSSPFRRLVQARLSR